MTALLLIIAFATFAFPALAWITTGTTTLPPMFHPMDDLFGWNLEGRMQQRDSSHYSRWTLPLASTALSFLLIFFGSWTAFEDSISLRVGITAFSFIIAWRAATQDIDLAEPKPQTLERVLILALLPAIFLYPGFLFLFLYVAIVPLRSWEHHTYTTLRILLLFLGAWIAASLGLRGLTSATLWLTLAVTALPYVRAGFEKMRLSPAWPLENRLDLHPLTGWLWGWRPLSPKATLKLSKFLRPLNVPIQIGIILFEVGFALVLFHPTIACAFLSTSIVFHLLVFALCGIFFWQSIATNLIVLLWIWTASSEVTALTFGWIQGFVALAWIALAWFWRRVYYTKSLAWWTAPLNNRVYWVLEGESGKKYGLTNDFMDPHERLFGQSLPQNLSTKPITTLHMGETKNRELFQELVAHRNDPEALKRLINKYSFHPLKGNRLPISIHFLEQFFTNFNKGIKKCVCPKLLKAPLGQIFNQAPWPKFEGQEKVKAIHWIYRIEVFTDDGPLTIHEEGLMTQNLESKK
jgi:NADH:ubiquinone oxidoreductase subunit K